MQAARYTKDTNRRSDRLDGDQASEPAHDPEPWSIAARTSAMRASATSPW
jgi:hypothetical protein